MEGRDESPTPPQDHLSLDQVADLSAALLPPAEDDAARAHLAACPTCAAELGALADVTTLLAAEAAVPIPADVALRIDAAIADEARQRASLSDMPVTAASGSPASAAARAVLTSGSSAVGDLETVRARRARSSRLRRGAAALVGVAAVLGGGYLFGDALLSDVDLSSGDESMDTAAEGASSGASDSGAEAPAVAESGSSYTAATLPDDVARLLERSYAAAPDPTSSSRVLDEDAAADTGRCVDAISARADGASTPLAVDVGSFDGAPAVVVVLALPSTSDAEAEVWVVSDACLLPGQTGLKVLDRVQLADLPSTE